MAGGEQPPSPNGARYTLDNSASIRDRLIGSATSSGMVGVSQVPTTFSDRSGVDHREYWHQELRPAVESATPANANPFRALVSRSDAVRPPTRVKLGQQPAPGFSTFGMANTSSRRAQGAGSVTAPGVLVFPGNVECVYLLTRSPGRAEKRGSTCREHVVGGVRRIDGRGKPSTIKSGRTAVVAEETSGASEDG